MQNLKENETLVKIIAKMCHEANRAYCFSIGDDSQKPWEESPNWQQQSAINGVVYYLETRATPEEMHQNWMKEKEDDGWVYGEIKDPKKKTHPCMVDYHELPQSQRKKDYIFQNIVGTMVGYLT